MGYCKPRSGGRDDRFLMKCLFYEVGRYGILRIFTFVNYVNVFVIIGIFRNLEGEGVIC